VNLNTEIMYLAGVGPKKAALLKKELNITTYEDLLYYFPYKYIDRTKFYTLAQIHPDMPYIQAKGHITSFRKEGQGAKMRLVANFTDGTETIELIWFQGISWITESYTTGVEYIIFGKPTIFNSRINIAHPEMEEAAKQGDKLRSSMEAAYNTTEKMKRGFLTSKAIYKLIQSLMKLVVGKVDETLPDSIINAHKLLPINKALFNIHFPENPDLLLQAQTRLKFEELFYIQLNMLYKKGLRDYTFKGHIFGTVGEKFNHFYKNNLPFELTNAQKRVLREIRTDTKTGKQMNRLLQGDVGSGKTLVALLTMLLALDNGFQACLMAPTEILANQHLETITAFLTGMDINIKLLTGSTKTKARKQIHAELLDGSLHILIGTHALIEDVVQFSNLGMVIIDEQHRFGVAQRAQLWKKNTLPPHILVMTATPIPRTLAMTLYGDLDVSVIDELPPGRKPIKTHHQYDGQRLKVFGFLRKQIEAGRQIYIVYPLISESEKMDYKDLEDGYESISRAFPPPKYAVSILHGKMKAEEKDKAMSLFTRGITHIMVATTVIEVGVNVPNASVMVIESAERFGLSQLHQLRGRVGRGADQSFCILMTDYKLSAEARKRIQTMVSTNDGFEIAEADLKLRGPGDIEGTQQSGIPLNLKIANLGKDSKILQYARNVAIQILSDDPSLQKPENQALIRQLKKLNPDTVQWGMIS